jgi:hypothetical protein
MKPIFDIGLMKAFWMFLMPIGHFSELKVMLNTIASAVMSNNISTIIKALVTLQEVTVNAR